MELQSVDCFYIARKKLVAVAIDVVAEGVGFCLRVLVHCFIGVAGVDFNRDAGQHAFGQGDFVFRHDGHPLACRTRLTRAPQAIFPQLAEANTPDSQTRAPRVNRACWGYWG